MKIRVIQKPQYTALCEVQIKKWWMPFWWEVHCGDKASCLRAANNLMQHGSKIEVLFEGDTNETTNPT